MPDKKPPQLRVYFRHNIRVIQPVQLSPKFSPNRPREGKFVPRGELWLCEIGTGNGIVRKFSKNSILFWDRGFIALDCGFWWSGFIFRFGDRGAEFTFSPKKSNDIIFCIPENYIIRIEDTANRDYLYQRLLPNPPLHEKKKIPQTCSLTESVINSTCCGTKPPNPPR